MKEIWRDVVEYPDIFMVSNLGRVWSKRTSKILAQGTTANGYKVVSSKIGGREGKSICKRVHRWVAEAFIENPHNKPFVNHKDGVKANNNYLNLEWCTSKENASHARDTGLLTTKHGTQHSSSKLTEEDVRFIRKNYGTITKRKLADMFNVGATTIQSVATFKSYKNII